MESSPTAPTATIYVKFPREEGFVVYPVEMHASTTYANHWDLYGSVNRYIAASPYVKIARLVGRPYQLWTHQGLMTTLRSPFTSEPWPVAGLPMHCAKPAILSYVPVATKATAPSDLLASERNYLLYVENKRKVDNRLALWRSMWPRSPPPPLSPVNPDAEVCIPPDLTLASDVRLMPLVDVQQQAYGLDTFMAHFRCSATSLERLARYRDVLMREIEQRSTTATQQLQEMRDLNARLMADAPTADELEERQRQLNARAKALWEKSGGGDPISSTNDPRLPDAVRRDMIAEGTEPASG